MLERVFDAATASLPSWIILGLLLVASIVVATWKVKSFWDRFSQIEKTVVAHEDLGPAIARVEKNVARLELNVTVLLSHFIAKQEIDPTLLESKSPLRITSLASDLLKASGFVDVYPALKSKFVDYVGSTKPRAKLDLENAAIQAVFVLLSEPEMTPFKNWLYENPHYKASDTVTVTNNELLTTAGVYVRDQLLKDEELMKKWGIT